MDTQRTNTLSQTAMLLRQAKGLHTYSGGIYYIYIRLVYVRIALMCMCKMKIDIEFTSHHDQMDITPATLANETDVYIHNGNQLK